MNLIKASYEILGEVNAGQMCKNIELYGRVCYKSESGIAPDSSESFIRKIIQNGHESVIEHEKITVKFICDRGVTHEIVRHRIASYSQESTRYCNYAKERFGRELTFIKPCFWDENDEGYKIWAENMQQTECSYLQMIDLGIPPEQARSILPNSLKTELIVTMNLRAWRHFFRLRASNRAHPQMREISRPLLEEMKRMLPAVFEDIFANP